MNHKLLELAEVIKGEYLDQVQIIIDNKICATPEEYVKLTVAGKVIETLTELLPNNSDELAKAAMDKYGDEFEIAMKEALTGIMGYSGTFFSISHGQE